MTAREMRPEDVPHEFVMASMRAFGLITAPGAREALAAVLPMHEVQVLADLERMIRASCFTCNPDAETGWIVCHCEVADELKRQRRHAAPQPDTTKET